MKFSSTGSKNSTIEKPEAASPYYLWYTEQRQTLACAPSILLTHITWRLETLEWFVIEGTAATSPWAPLNVE